MPVNCSADVEAAIVHIDQALTSGNTVEINKIKDAFGFQDMTHLDDVAGARKFPGHVDVTFGFLSSWFLSAMEFMGLAIPSILRGSRIPVLRVL